MASGLKGTSKPAANTDTTLYTCSGSATVVNINVCNQHASTGAEVVVSIVPSGQTKAATHGIEYNTAIAGKGVLERTGIAMGVGDFIVVSSSTAHVSFNVWGVDLS